jgi:hypothetical protein
VNINPLGTKAALDIGVDAKGSQQLVVVLVILAGISMGVTAFFMWHRHELWGWLAGATVGFVAAAIWCHSKSRLYLDRVGALPTRFTPTPDGVVVETDALTLADPQAAAALERVMAAAFHRIPLPPPDGRVLAGQKVDQSPDAVRQAGADVAAVNQQAKDARQRTIELLTAGAGVIGGEIEQPAVLEPPATLPESGFRSTTPLS